MKDPYKGREQSKVKHFILRSYLQELAFKLLHAHDELAYVDGFFGPWKSKSQNFSDTSFAIALDTLKDAQAFFAKQSQKKTIRCFFVEEDPTSFKKLKEAVSPYNKPTEAFHVRTFEGKFEDAVQEITRFVNQSFVLLFIDPTGWTGYPYDKIGPLLMRTPGEVLINLMYDHVNRFAASDDPKIVQSFAPILGGPDWSSRLDPTLPRGRAIENCFVRS